MRSDIFLVPSCRLRDCKLFHGSVSLVLCASVNKRVAVNPWWHSNRGTFTPTTPTSTIADSHVSVGTYPRRLTAFSQPHVGITPVWLGVAPLLPLWKLEVAEADLGQLEQP